MRRSRKGWTSVLLAVGCLLVGGCSSAFSDRKELPDLPRFTSEEFPPTTRNRISQVYRAARENPDHAQANGNLGIRLHAHQQFLEAEICYERAHLLAPDVFRWAYYLGVVQALRGQHAKAVISFRAAQRLNPIYPALSVRLAEALLAAGELAESQELFETLVRKHPQMAEAHYGLGRTLSALDKPDVAVEHYRKACDLAPSFGAAHYALALAYRDLGETARAREHFVLHEKERLAVPATVDPLIEEVEALKAGALEYLTEGEALAAAGKMEEAVTQYERAIEMDPQLVQARINLLIAYGELGLVEKAEQHYRAGVKINPNHAELHNNFGVLASRLERHREAEDALRRAIEIRPNYAEAHNNLGHVLEQEGRVEEAAAHYRKSIDNRPNYRLSRFNLGWILLNQGRHEEAIEQFQRTLTPEDDQTPGFMFGLAAAYGRAGEREKALHYAQEAHRRATALGQTDLAAMIEKNLQEVQASQ